MSGSSAELAAGGHGGYSGWTFSAPILIILVAFLALVIGPAEHNHEPSTTEELAREGYPKDPEALEHVIDDKKGTWEVFTLLHPRHVQLRKIFGLQLTKFMVLEVVSALLILAIYLPLAQRLRSGAPASGGWQNAFEVLLTFVRDRVARPSMGEHDADRFAPFLWTLFLFILFNNLLGMVPLGASATGSIYVTLALAICVFFAIHGSGIVKMGFVHYLQSLWPHMHVPFGLGYFLKPLLFILELISVLVRNAVLAVRLFANMFAGHMVLATILVFIYMARANPGLWATVTVSSVFGMLALSLLELFVAFLQAYIFVFLTALFMGMALHPAH